MEFIGDVAQKTGDPSLLAVEAAKASKAMEIGKASGLFRVPKVINFDAEAGVLEFERLTGLTTLLDLAVLRDSRLPELMKIAGQALAVIHKELTLPEEMKHELPPEWMDPADKNVFIHGDFACINVCFYEPSGELVILDFSGAPMVGRTPTFGSRYFDIILFISSLFHGAPCRRVFGWGAEEMAVTFLKGYDEASPGTNLSKLKDYSSEMFRMQWPNIRCASKQRRPLSALVLIACQMLMYARFRSLLHKQR